MIYIQLECCSIIPSHYIVLNYGVSYSREVILKPFINILSHAEPFSLHEQFQRFLAKKLQEKIQQVQTLHN